MTEYEVVTTTVTIKPTSKKSIGDIVYDEINKRKETHRPISHTIDLNHDKWVGYISIIFEELE